MVRLQKAISQSINLQGLVCEIVFVTEPYQTLQIDWIAKLLFVTEPYQTLQIDWLRNCFLLSNLTKPCKLIDAKLFFVIEP